MKTLLTPCIVFKFANNEIVTNMRVEEPSYRGIEAFANNASCCDLSPGICMSLGIVSKGSPFGGVGSTFTSCCN